VTQWRDRAGIAPASSTAVAVRPHSTTAARRADSRPFLDGSESWAALADRVLQPWWYDVALGLLLFGFLASYAFDSLWVTFPALVVFMAALGALVRAYQRITGIWVNTPRRVFVLWAAVVLVVLVPAGSAAPGAAPTPPRCGRGCDRRRAAARRRRPPGTAAADLRPARRRRHHGVRGRPRRVAELRKIAGV
jgi:hypothetical protein